MKPRLACSLAVVAVLATACRTRPPAPAQTVVTPLPLPALDEATEFLASADSVVLRMGYTGAASPHVFAFARLLREPDAVARFEALTEGDTLAGRAYGLCGLALLDPARVEDRLGRLQGKPGWLRIQHGCELEVLTLAAAQEQIRSGALPRELDALAQQILALQAAPDTASGPRTGD